MPLPLISTPPPFGLLPLYQPPLPPPSTTTLYLVNYTLECGSATLVMATFMVQSQLHVVVAAAAAAVGSDDDDNAPLLCPPLHPPSLHMSKCCNLRHNPRLTSPASRQWNPRPKRDEADDFSELHSIPAPAAPSPPAAPLAIAFCLLIALPSPRCCS